MFEVEQGDWFTATCRIRYFCNFVCTVQGVYRNLGQNKTLCGLVYRLDSSNQVLVTDVVMQREKDTIYGQIVPAGGRLKVPVYLRLQYIFTYLITFLFILFFFLCASSRILLCHSYITQTPVFRPLSFTTTTLASSSILLFLLYTLWF